MGTITEAKCDECGYAFNASSGGGFNFVLLRCNKCGKTLQVDREEYGVKAYEQGFFVEKPHTFTNRPAKSWGLPDERNKDYDFSRVPYVDGPCDGVYTVSAPERCPICSSTKITLGGITALYD